MEWYEAAFDRLYPVLYEYRDIDESMSVVETYGGLFEETTPILDLASGGGRYLESLLRRGFDAYGLDLSHYLLRRSLEEWGHTGRVLQGDMRHLPFVSESFGGVWNMFTSFGYFSADTDNLLVFREVERVLRPGGKFLFDFVNSNWISRDLLAQSSRRSGEYDILEKRGLESHGKYLVKHAVITDRRTGKRDEISERLRLYTRDDLVTMFTSVGLTIDGTFGDYEGNPFVDGVSERVIILARK
jgi:SAM-dependent methyltransferase